MVLARDKEAHRNLSQQFEQRKVEKQYEAVVNGQLQADEGEADFPLICDWPNRPRQKVDYEQGKPSLTRWRVKAREGDRTRVELFPYTGRSHQLRVHMLALGHPILGDPLYAQGEALRMAARLLLHATELGFYHPDGEFMNFHSEAPF